MNNFRYLLGLILLLSFSSCAHYKDIPYFQNANEYDGTGKEYLYDITIKPKDQLVIFVYSGIDKTSVALFNTREPREIDMSEVRNGGIRSYNSGRIRHYLVENDGTIDFPLLGRVKVDGLTVEQANKKIQELVKPYLAEGADCVVNTIIDNFEVTVMGEVKRPNTFTVTRNKMTILEALAMAGDMTIYGKRDNVKLLRELPDGTYEVHELDMRDANILNSPYYYLHQRDIVYVEPNEAMAQNTQIGQTTRLWVRGASITISLGSLLYRVLQ
jgi:polysaccharide export outer membrane protein